MSSALVIGLGSPHGDDQAGWQVVEKMHRLGVSTEDARIVHTPADLCHVGSSGRPLVICDAGKTIGTAGTVEVWTWPAQSLPLWRGGTHDISLEDALLLGAQLGTIPSTVAIWIINGRNFRPMDAPSTEVVTAAERLAVQFWSQWHHA